MPLITIHPKYGDKTPITIDTDRPKEENTKRDYKNDLHCHVEPFFGVPLRLYIDILTNGDIAFNGWTWVSGCNTYLHTDVDQAYNDGFKEPTAEQIETVSGLFSGRIKFDGIEIAIGNSVQTICPIDLKSEENRIHKKIYLNLKGDKG